MSADHFEHDGAGLGGNGLLQGFDVVERHLREAGHVGLEALTVLLPPGGGQRSQRPAVEAVFHGNDLVAAGLVAVLAGDLDEPFVGFGAGVAEKDLGVQSRFGDQFFGQRGGEGVHVDIGDMDQSPGLPRDGGGDPGMAVSQIADGDA